MDPVQSERFGAIVLCPVAAHAISITNSCNLVAHAPAVAGIHVWADAFQSWLQPNVRRIIFGAMIQCV